MTLELQAGSKTRDLLHIGGHRDAGYSRQRVLQSLDCVALAWSLRMDRVLTVTG